MCEEVRKGRSESGAGGLDSQSLTVARSMAGEAGAHTEVQEAAVPGGGAGVIQ